MADAEERNKSVVKQFTEAQSNHRLDLLDGLLAPDFLRHCQATPWLEVRSRDDFKRFLEADRAAVPDGQIEPRLIVGEGDYVAVYCNYTGTQVGPWGPFPASNRRFDLDFSGVFRIAGGRIAELWITWDNLSLLSQLGHWAPPV